MRNDEFDYYDDYFCNDGGISIVYYCIYSYAFGSIDNGRVASQQLSDVFITFISFLYCGSCFECNLGCLRHDTGISGIGISNFNHRTCSIKRKGDLWKKIEEKDYDICGYIYYMLLVRVDNNARYFKHYNNNCSSCDDRVYSEKYNAKIGKEGGKCCH